MHDVDVAPMTQRVIGSRLRVATWMVNGSGMGGSGGDGALEAMAGHPVTWPLPWGELSSGSAKGGYFDHAAPPSCRSRSRAKRSARCQRKRLARCSSPQKRPGKHGKPSPRSHAPEAPYARSGWVEGGHEVGRAGLGRLAIDGPIIVPANVLNAEDDARGAPAIWRLAHVKVEGGGPD
eukprot:scaffold92693_cov61-Phaeocystis_antarctica.AAC.5